MLIQMSLMNDWFFINLIMLMYRIRDIFVTKSVSFLNLSCGIILHFTLFQIVEAKFGAREIDPSGFSVLNFQFL